MNIALISPYPDLGDYGVRLLSACLLRAGHRVRLLIMPGGYHHHHDDKALVALSRQVEGCDLVGISVMSNFWENAVQITRWIHEHHSMPVVWGGAHPTLLPEQSIEDADILCIGEAEENFPDLADALQRGRSLADVRGIWFRTPDGVVRNPGRPAVEDLDSLPFPDYDFDHQYHYLGGRFRPLDLKAVKWIKGRVYLTIPSRGCPCDCAYCCSSAMKQCFPVHPTRVRRRSIQNVVDEITYGRRQMPFINQVIFQDESFFSLPLGLIQEYAEQYRRQVGLPLTVVSISPAATTEAKVEALVRAGMFDLRMGIQTGSKRTQKLFNRPHTNEHVIEAAHHFHRFRDEIKLPQYDLIIDNPWEDDQDRIDTLKLLTQLPAPYRLCLLSLTVFPGTGLYQRAVAEGKPMDVLNDVYRKDIYNFSDTYMNRLFALSNLYAINGSTLSPGTVDWLTSDRLKRSGMRSLAYSAMRARALPLQRRSLHSLMGKVLSDISEGENTRILRFLAGHR